MQRYVIDTAHSVPYSSYWDIFHVTDVLSADSEPAWLLQDATFEKMGVLMADNNGRLLGIYDELSSFLTKIKLYGNRGLSDSHELAMFLELYNANPWTRTTGAFVKNKACIN